MTTDELAELGRALFTSSTETIDRLGLKREEVALYIDVVLDDGSTLRANLVPPLD